MCAGQLNVCTNNPTDGSGALPSITSASSINQQQQQHSPDFGISGMRARTSSNASSITAYDAGCGDAYPFRARSVSNASSLGSGIGVTPPSLSDFADQDPAAPGVSL